jgi:hypothetical protein
MMNSKGFGRKWSRPNRSTTWCMPGETKEIHKKNLPRQLIMKLTFKPTSHEQKSLVIILPDLVTYAWKTFPNVTHIRHFHASKNMNERTTVYGKGQIQQQE